MIPNKPTHRKTLKRFHRPGDFHELTFSTYRRVPLLVGDRLQGLAQPIDDAGSQLGITLVAFAFMPEHLHLLSFPTVDEPDTSSYLARFKQSFSKLVKDELIAADLCDNILDWKWSSACYYDEEHSGKADPDLPMIDGLPSGWSAYRVRGS